MPTEVGFSNESVERLMTSETTEWLSNKAKRPSALFVGYKQDNCMEQRSQDFQERARRWELTDRELFGVRLKLGEDDFTTAGGLLYLVNANEGKNFESIALADKICMMMTRLACNRAIESSYWRTDNNSDVGLLTGYVLYRLPIELESMDLDTFSRWFGLHPSLHTSW
jgi:hypothetical protein